ncbi:hypothetical protein Dimus_027448 [Dionaea muscipula]
MALVFVWAGGLRRSRGLRTATTPRFDLGECREKSGAEVGRRASPGPSPPSSWSLESPVVVGVGAGRRKKAGGFLGCDCRVEVVDSRVCLVLIFVFVFNIFFNPDHPSGFHPRVINRSLL